MMRIGRLSAMVMAFGLGTSGVALATPDSGGRVAPGGPVATVPTLTTAPPTAAAEPAACPRKVKVVYAGYGEADRAACPAGQLATR